MPTEGEAEEVMTVEEVKEEPKEERVATFGEARVRVSFNPSGNDKVDEIKKLVAALIDLVEGEKDVYSGAPNERNRCLAIAQTHLEDAGHWAVKGVTAS